MITVIALLRGVNVGGHGKIRMETLRELLDSLRLRDVRTYLQSGNAVFRCPEKGLPRLAVRIEEAIERECGFRPAVLLRTAEELRLAAALNPFRDFDPAKLAVLFSAAAIAPGALAGALEMRVAPDELRSAGRELYAHYPNGFAGSKLTVPALERVLGVRLTGRNWNTISALLEMSLPGGE
jgi:uncharacterized protein (DUF1697 family)